MPRPIPAFLGPLHEILPKPATAQAEETPAAAKNALPLRMPTQTLSNWCWAATTEAVHAFYREPGAKRQCEVATRFLNRPCCPPDGPGPDDLANPRNRIYNLETALEGNGKRPAIDRALDFEEVAAEIEGGHPICCQIGWFTGGDPHFTVICGYSRGSPEKVIVRDPKFGEVELGYAEFRDCYRSGGKWMRSLKTKKA